MSATDKTYIDNVTSFAAADANSITLDINNAVTSSAQVLNGTSNNQTAVTMNTYSHNGQSYTAGGSVNTYTLTQAQSTLHAILAYVDGTKVRFRAGVTNTGGSTVDVSSAGVKDIMTSAGVALVGGEIQAGAWIELTYDSGDGAFLITSSSVAAAALVPRGYLSGFGMSNNAVDADNDIDFAAGVASDLAGAGTITNIAAGVSMTKQLDNVWVQGTGLGGRAVGVALSNDTWYRCFAIANTGGTVDFGFDTSATAANLLADAQGDDATYAYARQVGWVRTDGSQNIVAFIQDGDYFTWAGDGVPFTTLFTGSTSRTAIDVSSQVPPLCTYLGNTKINPDAVGNFFLNITELNQFDTVPVSGSALASSNSNGADSGSRVGLVRCKVSSSGEIFQRANSARPCRIVLSSYFYDRGKG
mgnify:CR=1 FL=1|tara:strand:- start:494 stop:1738 length:1245 start_codon:yes stop_codon:yes gene_type:complete